MNVQKKTQISFIIPVHNEAKILQKNIERLYSFCDKNNINPEVLLCENGSSDQSKKIISSMKYLGIRKIFMAERGLGRAYREGIRQSTHNIVYFTGIDFPFGYKNITDCLKSIGQNDVVFASKSHPKSIIKNSLKRKLISSAFHVLVGLLLGLRTKDPQGCVMFRRDKILAILDNCDSNTAFFETQLALYCERASLKTIEIPVRYFDARPDSKMNIKADSKAIFKEIFLERKKIKEQGGALSET